MPLVLLPITHTLTYAKPFGLAWLDVTRLVAMAALRRLMGSKAVYVVG